MPRDLDGMLAKERVDDEAGIRYAAEAESFLDKMKIDGTSVLGATCGKSLCRVSFEHRNSEAFKQYQMRFAFSPWGGSSNYFSADPNENGPWKSFVWVGRNGFVLPLEELRQRNASFP
ncbi:MAG: hypothetical protein PHU25_13955 [Deltaproteobacteria bacterium]|nr:hypothetical protein [Deltaproteobacteria bacterium]